MFSLRIQDTRIIISGIHKNYEVDNMFDTIIIGGGIAGMTAALYASRKNMNFKIFAEKPGGQFMVSGDVENYPGIVKTTGVDFFKKMQEQMEHNNIEIEEKKVTGIEKKGETFKVKTGEDDLDAKTVIICTGSHARKLGVEGEERLANKGLTYCSVCDGPVFKGKEVAVIGGGNSALEAADFMKDIAKKIHLLVLGERFEGHEGLIENVKKIDKVEVYYKAETTEIYGEKFVEGLKYRQEGEEKELEVEGVVIEIGRVPNTDFLKGFLELDEHGHVKVDCQGRTDVPGVFAAGDCASGHEYQYVIAAGQGCMSLLKVARYLANKKE